MIQLTEKYYLSKDRGHLVLKHPRMTQEGPERDINGNIKFAVVAYYNSFNEVADGLVKRELKDIDFDRLRSLDDLAAELSEKIQEQIETVKGDSLERFLDDFDYRTDLMLDQEGEYEEK